MCSVPVLVKFDEHARSAQTDPGAVALCGVALATLDDDPGVALTRARVYRRQGAVVHGHRRTPPIPSAYPRPERSPQFLTGGSHAIAVRAAALSVCSSFGEGTFAGKQGNRRDAPKAGGRGLHGRGRPTGTHLPSGRDLSGSFPIDPRELIKGGLQGLRQKSQRVALR